MMINNFRTFSISNQSTAHNTLTKDLGSTSINERIKNDPLVDKVPKDLINGMWKTIQPYGLFDHSSFQEFCLKNNKVPLTPFSSIDSLLKTYKEYGIIADKKVAMDIFNKYPKVLLVDPKITQRLLSTMYKFLNCEKEYVGNFIVKEPVILLTKVTES